MTDNASFYSLLPAPIDIDRLVSPPGNDTLQILGIFKSDCSACKGFAPFFLRTRAIVQTPSWYSGLDVRPSLEWIDGHDENNEQLLVSVGIDWHAYPAFFSRANGSKQWQEMDRKLVADNDALKRHCEQIHAKVKDDNLRHDISKQYQVEAQKSRELLVDQLQKSSHQAAVSLAKFDQYFLVPPRFEDLV